MSNVTFVAEWMNTVNTVKYIQHMLNYYCLTEGIDSTPTCHRAVVIPVLSLCPVTRRFKVS